VKWQDIIDADERTCRDLESGIRFTLEIYNQDKGSSFSMSRDDGKYVGVEDALALIINLGERAKAIVLSSATR